MRETRANGLCYGVTLSNPPRGGKGDMATLFDPPEPPTELECGDLEGEL